MTEKITDKLKLIKDLLIEPKPESIEYMKERDMLFGELYIYYKTDKPAIIYEPDLDEFIEHLQNKENIVFVDFLNEEHCKAFDENENKMSKSFLKNNILSMVYDIITGDIKAETTTGGFITLNYTGYNEENIKCIQTILEYNNKNK